MSLWSQLIKTYDNIKKDSKVNDVCDVENFLLKDGLVAGNVDIEVVIDDNAKFIDLISNTIKIPVLGYIKAGVPIEAQEDIIDYVDIPAIWTKGGKDFYALKISGDSMTPKYNEGDIVIFEQTKDYEAGKNKDCAVMVNCTECTFKKVFIDEQGITLQPYNMNYEPMRFTKEQAMQLPITIVGIAKEKRVSL